MSIFNYENKKPQMNADERRFVDFNLIFAAFAFWYEKINNELGRTLYELTLPEFVSVRISSLFFLCSFMKHGFIADFAVKTFVFDGSDAL